MPGIGPDQPARHQADQGGFGTVSRQEGRSDEDAVANSRDLYSYLNGAIRDKTRECFVAIFLDSKNRVITMDTLFEGTLTASGVYPREVVRAALQHHAAALIFAHNHPSGEPRPSSEDMAVTRQLVFAARLMGITVHEHLIIGDNQLLQLCGPGPHGPVELRNSRRARSAGPGAAESANARSELMADLETSRPPECFARIETVFPIGADGLRQTPPECLECDVKTDCLRVGAGRGTGAGRARGASGPRLRGRSRRISRTLGTAEGISNAARRRSAPLVALSGCASGAAHADGWGTAVKTGRDTVTELRWAEPSSPSWWSSFWRPAWSFSFF
ncbi:MAG: JAB domain-containing protein [Desulfobacterales bacterium]|nr:JAB domain-containing protein [Desulfobacterales bacterium]